MGRTLRNCLTVCLVVLSFVFLNSTGANADDDTLPSGSISAVKVTSVRSPMFPWTAYSLQIKPGDIIFWMEGQRVTTEQELTDRLRPMKNGQHITVRLLRNGQVREHTALVVSAMLPRRGVWGAEFETVTIDWPSSASATPITKAMLLDKVKKIWRNSDAEQSGLQAGDVILEMNGRTVIGAEERQNALKESKQTKEVSLTYLHNGEKITKTIPLKQLRGMELVSEILDLPSAESTAPAATTVASSSPAGTQAPRAESATIAVAPETASNNQLTRIGYVQGVGIAQVENGPAAAAGLKPGDIVIEIDGAPVENAKALTQEIRSHRPGDQVNLQVLRGNTQLAMTVALGQGEANKAVLGANIATVTVGEMPVHRTQPALFVKKVEKGSLAKSIGLQNDDIIARIDGIPVGSNTEFRNAIGQHKSSEPMIAEYYRDGQLRRVSVPVPVGLGMWGVQLETNFAPAGAASFPQKWPVFPEIADVPNANEQQKADLAQFRKLREQFLRLTGPDFKPQISEHKSNNDRKAKIFCENVNGPAEIFFDFDHSRPINNQWSYMRVESAGCGASDWKNTTAFMFFANNTWWFGPVTISKGTLYPSLSNTGVVGTTNGLVSLRNQSAWNSIVMNPNGDMLLRNAALEPLVVGSVVAGTVMMRDIGSVDGEVANGTTFRPSATSVLYAADGSYRASGPLRLTATPDADQSFEFGDKPFSLEFDGPVRFDTKNATSMGPAGTYLFTGRLALNTLPLADEIQPAPGTLAQYATAARTCAFQPPSRPGWLMWAPNCAADKTHADVWSVNGSYRMRYTRGAVPILQSFDPEHPGEVQREWHATTFTGTQKVVPVGKAELWEWGSLVYRGKFKGLEPDGDGECAVPGAPEGTMEPCTFADGKRSDTLYLARVEQQKLDASSQQREAQAVQERRHNRDERARVAREIAESIRLRQQQEAAARRAEQRAKSARRAAMFGQFIQGMQQAANEISVQMAENAAREQARQAQLRVAQQQAELKRQEQEAASRERMAQRQQMQAAAAADQARSQQMRQQAELAAQKAAAERRAAAAEKMRAQQAQREALLRQQKANLAAIKVTSCINQSTGQYVMKGSPDEKLFCNGGGNGSGGGSNGGVAGLTTSAGSGLNGGSSSTAGNGRSGGSPSNAEDNRILSWPEGLVVCQERDGCTGPFQSVAGTKRSDVMSACGLNGRDIISDYGTFGNYRVWGCGFGLNVHNAKGTYREQYQRDLGSERNIHPPQRKTFHCSLKDVGTSNYCYKR